jgi:hypothetical protein
LIFSYALAADALLTKLKPVFLDIGCDDLAKHLFQTGNVTRAPSKQVEIARGPMWLITPDGKQQRPLEDKLASVRTSTQPIHRALKPVASESEIEILLPFFSQIEEPLANRGGKIARRQT